MLLSYLQSYQPVHHRLMLSICTQWPLHLVPQLVNVNIWSVITIMWQELKACRHDLEVLLFRPNSRMGRKCDLNEFDCRMIVGMIVRFKNFTNYWSHGFSCSNVSGVHRKQYQKQKHPVSHHPSGKNNLLLRELKGKLLVLTDSKWQQCSVGEHIWMHSTWNLEVAVVFGKKS